MNKASGGDGIPAEPFQTLKDDAVKMFHSVCQQIWKTAVATGLEKFNFHTNPDKGKAKGCWNYHTILLISHISEVMLRILQARFQEYMNQELPNIQTGFRKGRGMRCQIANICRIINKAREFQKIIYFCFIDYAKAFDCVDHNKLWKILRDGNFRPSYLPPAKPVCRSRSNSYNWTWNSWLFQKLGKERCTSRLYSVTLLI